MPVDVPGDRDDSIGEEHTRAAQDSDVRKREDGPDFLACLSIRQVPARHRASTSVVVWYGSIMGAALTRC